MKVLFSIERNHPQLGLSPDHYCMVGAFEAHYGEQQRARFYYDVYTDSLYDAVVKFRPDVLVAKALIQLADKNIPPEAYSRITKELGIPVIMVWGESAPHVVQWADMYAPHTTATVFLDTAEHWKQFTQYPDKCHWIPEPKDPRIFNAAPISVRSEPGHYSEQTIERDIPISFIGSLLGRWDRAFNLAYCWSNGIDVQRFGGLDDATASHIKTYADYLQSSQITLNFTSAVSFQHINARTSEATMCGALLMESESAETARLLTPYVHYVPFKEPFHIDENTGQLINQPGDLIEKLRHYMGPGQAEARQIAEAGQKRAMELFDGRMFWNKVFELAGVK